MASEECTGLPKSHLNPHIASYVENQCIRLGCPQHLIAPGTCPSSPGILSCSGNQGHFWDSLLGSSSYRTSTFTRYLL